MLDVDQRVADGLRDLAGRAPVDADVWPAAERYVARHRRRRHAITGALVAVALVGGGLGTAVVVRRADPSVKVADSGPGGGTSLTTPSGALPAAGPVNGSFTLTVGAGGKLEFDPASVSVTTGIYAVTVVDGANTQHTLSFDDPATLWTQLVVNTQGESQTSRVFFGAPGTYGFYCAITGHRAAGEQGVVNVTGPTITLAQAAAASTSSAG